MKFSPKLDSGELFGRITAHPILMLVLSFIVICACASGLVTLVKDTSVKAFIPSGHGALLASEKAADVFGLSDPVAIAVVSADGSSVFTADRLALIADLSERVAKLPNVRAGRVASLATESSISGDDGEISVTAYISSLAASRESAFDTRARWRAMPPHRGTLVSNDESSAVIVAELVDPDLADETYASVLQIVSEINHSDVDIHVAGSGAVSGYLSRYIDRDARKLQPLVFALVLSFIYLAFRRLSSLPGPLFVVLGAVGGSLGIMAWAGIPYYAITNALPVILVAISVADAIHILSAYYQHRAQDETASERELIIRAMTDMSRPITLTTITTIAGFLGIAAVSVMPPVTFFAWFAVLGVAMAWVFSMFALPNILLLIKPGPSPAFANWRQNRPSGVGVLLASIGAFAAARYRLVLTVFAIVAAVALAGASQLRVDRSQIDSFSEDEPIRIADSIINELFAGTAFLDVIVETSEVEGLLNASRMAKIVKLQQFFEALPNVQKTVAITDYLSLLHSAIQEIPATDGAERQLPDTDAAIAQYLLVYEVSGDPADLEEEIDYNYQTALVRGVMNAHYFSETRLAVESLADYIATEFNEPGMSATISGDVNISYHWMASLRSSHFLGVSLSLSLVLLTSIFVFRSVASGIIAVVPVSFTVLILYGCMGYLGIFLEPATSMFAAIALGVGVDFSIHLVDRLKIAVDRHQGDIHAAVASALPPTARACLFNSAALGLGFSVLLLSGLPTLQRFGGLVAVAALSSFFTALVLVPSLYAMHLARQRRSNLASNRRAIATGISLAFIAGASLYSDSAVAADDQAMSVAAKVAARKEGAAMRRLINITLTDRRGNVRERQALVLKRSEETVRQTRITYLAPKSVRGVTFLSHDYHEASQTDDRWLYIPATRKVRRVPASGRGDYFLGTDFTYEDIQSELKFDIRDYAFEYRGNTVSENAVLHQLRGVPVDVKTARELGYGAIEVVVDEATWIPVSVDFFDLEQQPLKTVVVSGIEMISGIWTATGISAINHKTGHRTRFEYQEVEYPDKLPVHLFNSSILSRGLPAAFGEK